MGGGAGKNSRYFTYKIILDGIESLFEMLNNNSCLIVLIILDGIERLKMYG